MFSLGFYEWILILFVVIVFVKPKDYPQLFRKIGQLFNKCDRIWKSVLNEIDFYKD
tara:strand:- start:1085 stop:1252 length:168 start_codon:yes stop_codon:yes gene_type:complete